MAGTAIYLPTVQPMPDLSAHVDIPNRALFKAAEVCDILNVQPYVLRSWEAEFPELGVSKTAGGPRVYRRTDVEQVARIRHLLLVEGLTLAGARRKLEEDSAPVAADAPAIDELIGQNARERLTAVKRGLRSILELLTDATTGYQLAAATETRTRAASGVSRTKPPRRKVARHAASGRRSSTRRAPRR
jgi:DNA-binding transcriptional MerR regulator